MMIAVCGLNCGDCDIRLVPTDVNAARRVIAWFKQMEWLAEDEGLAEVIERHMYCQGCRGDRSIHWSADCWILKCCVDDRRLEHCHQCNEFPCEKLLAWSRQNAGYAQALNRLQDMRDELHEGLA